MRNFSVFPLQWKQRGHELDAYASQADVVKADLYWVGSARAIEQWQKRLDYDLAPSAYIGDEDVGYSGESVIISPYDENLANKLAQGQIRLICAEYNYDKYKEYEQFWLQRGAVLNQTFFQAEVFWPIVQVYKKDFLCLDRIEIFLTDRCTLNCEKCLHFIPYLHTRVDTPLEQLKKDADILFARVDYVQKLKLLGGEVFLYPHLTEYLRYLHEHYRTQIGEIRLGTNGTILPPKDILNTCHSYGIIVDISDYSVAVKGKYNLQECVDYFQGCGVAVDIKRSGETWLDMGFPIAKPPTRTEEENQIHFSRCAMFCRQFAKGKLYFCCSNYAAVRAGLFPDDEDNFFDFYAEPFNKKALLEFELGFNPKGYLSFCEYCFGGSAQNNPHEVAVAEQAQYRNELIT